MKIVKSCALTWLRQLKVLRLPLPYISILLHSESCMLVENAWCFICVKTSPLFPSRALMVQQNESFSYLRQSENYIMDSWPYMDDLSRSKTEEALNNLYETFKVTKKTILRPVVVWFLCSSFDFVYEFIYRPQRTLRWHRVLVKAACIKAWRGMSELIILRFRTLYRVSKHNTQLEEWRRGRRVDEWDECIHCSAVSFRCKKLLLPYFLFMVSVFWKVGLFSLRIFEVRAGSTVNPLHQPIPKKTESLHGTLLCKWKIELVGLSHVKPWRETQTVKEISISLQTAPAQSVWFCFS